MSYCTYRFAKTTQYPLLVTFPPMLLQKLIQTSAPLRRKSSRCLPLCPVFLEYFLRSFCNVCAITWSSWSQICNHRRQKLWESGKGRCPFWFIKIKIQPIFLKNEVSDFYPNELLDFLFCDFFPPIGSIDAIYAVWGFRRGKPAGATLLAGNHQVFLGEKGSVEDCTTKFYKVPFSPNKILVWAVLNPGQWMYQCATEFMESSAILNQIRLNCRLPSFWIVGTLGGLAEQPFWHLQIDRLLWSSGMIPYYPLLWSHWRLHSILWFRCFKFLSFKSCFHSPALFLIKSMLWVSTEKSSWLRLL